jgi:glycosyltransferase involved in cell wall biosynthesis
MSARGLQVAEFSRTAGRNPYIPLLYEHLAALGIPRAPQPRFELGWLWRSRRAVTFLHFHWGPDRFYAFGRRRWLGVGRFAARLLAARVLGYRVVWTIHEVHPPHSTAGRRIDRAAARILARVSHVLLAHDGATAERARGELGRVADRVEIVPHASYLGVYPPGRPAPAVRAELGVSPDAFVLLSFGKLRRDKATELLLEAFAGLDGRDAVLVVAGLVEDRDVGHRLAEAAARDPRVRVRPGHVADERVAELFGAADAAVLARGEPWTSGSLILALSLGVPVVAARTYAELVGPEAGWLFDPGDAPSLGAALERAMAEGPRRRSERRAAALAQASRLPTWAQVAERTAALMLEAAGRERPR